MMKKIIFALFFGALLCPLAAATIPVLDKFQEVDIVAVDENGVCILHDGGILSVVNAEDLSDSGKNLLKKELDQVEALRQQKQKSADFKKKVVQTPSEPVSDGGVTASGNTTSILGTADSTSTSLSSSGGTADSSISHIKTVPLNRARMRVLIRNITYARGKLPELQQDLARAEVRKSNSQNICIHKHGKEIPPPFVWKDYQDEKKACCKAWIAAWIQCEEKKKEIQKIESDLADWNNELRQLQQQAGNVAQ